MSIKQMISNIINGDVTAAEKSLHEYLVKQVKEAAQPSSQVELTKFKGQKLPDDAWPNGVMYKGNNVYKAVYESGNVAIDAAVDKMQRNMRLDMQDSYLGYSPAKDVFIEGFDGWMTNDDGDNENCSPYIVFKMTADGNIKVMSSDTDMSGVGRMWYGKDGGWKEAKRLYPDLIDIRLD